MSVFIRLWKLFSSIKFAIALILIITCLGLIGIFTSSDLFGSWFFIIPGILLMLNILICSINRWRSIKKVLAGGQIKKTESFFDNSEEKVKILDYSLPYDEVSCALKNALKKRHYRVRSENDKGAIYITADKNRYFKLGTYLSHLSIILLVLAYIIGSVFGFGNESLIIAEGDVKEVGYNTGLSLKLISFTDEYYDDGNPSDYRSEVILYKDNQEATRAIIRVNHPLNYEGTSFYLSFFGPAVGIQITQNDETIFSGNIALSGILQNDGYYRYTGYIELEELGLSLNIISSAFNMADPVIPYGNLAVMAFKGEEEIGLLLLEKTTPIDVEGLQITYMYDSQYSGFKVRNDPGNALVWISCSLFITGLIMVFYFPYDQIWALLKQSSVNKSRLYIRSMNQRSICNALEIAKSVSVIEDKQDKPGNTQ